MLNKIVGINIIILLLLSISLLILPVEKAFALFIGFSLSFVSILISAWVLDAFWDREWVIFSKVFFFSLFGRFLSVLIIITILLGIIKIDEIYFTVSFIISYLCNSIIEMILFNKILDKKSRQ
ncbi:MAG: hypothetical protein BalsKO_10520 [Balneolaceae bacterium]